MPEPPAPTFRRVKRLELILDAIHAEAATRLLESLGVTGYTVLENAMGQGDRGKRVGGDISDVFTNWVIVTTCPPDRLPEIAAALQPLLQQHGGVLLTTDADWLEH
ncbi:MAG: transcriptional regulator [Planctomycetota bacterium]